jgi:hypothetical protein
MQRHTIVMSPTTSPTPGGSPQNSAPRARLERATYCLGGTDALVLCTPAKTHVASERNSQRQSVPERSSSSAAEAAQQAHLVCRRIVGSRRLLGDPHDCAEAGRVRARVRILVDGQVALERREVGSWSTASPLSPDLWHRWLTGSVSFRTSHSCTSRCCNALACHRSGRWRYH